MKFDKVGLYKPKGCKTYCFKIPMWAKPNKRHFNTRQSTKEEAEKVRDDFLTQKHNQVQGIIFNEAYLDKAIEAYMVAKGYLAKRSFTAYRGTVLGFKDFVAGKLGRIPKVQEIKKPLCEEYLQGLSDKGLNPHTRNDKRNIIANFFNYTVDNDWLLKSPIKKIPKITEPESEHPEPFNEKEVEMVLNELKRMKKNKRYKHKCYYEIMAIAYYAGARITEVTNLLRSDIDFNNYGIKLHNKTVNGEIYNTKTKRNWKPPITSELEPILRNWLKVTQGNPSDLLFPNSNGKPIKYDHIYNTIKRVIMGLGFSPDKIIKPCHRARHTFTSNQRRAGVDESLVQQALGHKSNIMTRHYTHLDPKYVRDRFNKVSYGQGKKGKV